jgi:YgiT-type zinc finger domain-containing protein
MAKTLNFKTIEEEVKFWESHSSADYWDKMEKVEFDVDLHRNFLHPKLIFIADRPVQCPRCHHDLEEAVIQYVTWHNGHLVIIRDVPVLRCRPNGHEYMLEQTLDQVERLLNLEKTQQLKPAETIHVPVFKLEMAA